MASTETAVKRGFKGAICPKCGEESIQVSLADVSVFYCSECQDEILLDDIRALIAGWTPVLAWLDTAPVCPEE
jgi:uncharacterized protein (DUF983 family)